MDINFQELFQDFRWFFELGYVTIIAVILTILLVNLEKKTIFKKALSTADATQKDKILSLAGTITSLIIYAIVWFANEMITQRTFFISFDINQVIATVPSGAVTTWLAAKGLYTLLHKWWNRIKEKKASSQVASTSSGDQVEASVAASSAAPKVSTKSIGAASSTKVVNTKSVASTSSKTKKLL